MQDPKHELWGIIPNFISKDIKTQRRTIEKAFHRAATFHHIYLDAVGRDAIRL